MCICRTYPYILNYRNEKQTIQLDDAAIVAGSLHERGEKVCVTTTDKMVFVYDTKQSKMLVKAKLVKKVISVTFAGDIVLLGDKYGNVYVLKGNGDLENVLGHTASSILCMLHDSVNGLLLTGDREEKIRVSRFPKVAIIERFCFGHKSAITAMCSISHNNMVSSSTDGSIIVWNHLQGRIVQRINLDKDTFASKLSYSGSLGVLAALTNVKTLQLYFRTKNGEFKLGHTVSLSVECLDISFVSKTSSLLAVPISPECPRFFSVSVSPSQESITATSDVSSTFSRKVLESWKKIDGSNAAKAVSASFVITKRNMIDKTFQQVMRSNLERKTKRRKIDNNGDDK